MHAQLLELLLSLSIILVLIILSVKLKLVDSTGITAALVIGLLIALFGGWKWLVIISCFYVLAGVATKYKYHLKLFLGAAEAKGGARAWKNVLGNGMVAALFAVAEGLFKGGMFFGGFLGAVSTAAADTLATELGLLYPGKPRLIVNLRRKVPPGTSGAISPYGELAIILASLVIGFIAILLGVEPELSPFKILSLSLISGFMGSTIDSFLGATIQAQYWCDKCSCFTEEEVHRCGERARLVRGFSFIDNHVVNLISTVCGGLIGLTLYVFI